MLISLPAAHKRSALYDAARGCQGRAHGPRKYAGPSPEVPRLAHQLRIQCMLGPDCALIYLGGVALLFASVSRRHVCSGILSKEAACGGGRLFWWSSGGWLTHGYSMISQEYYPSSQPASQSHSGTKHPVDGNDCLMLGRAGAPPVLRLHRPSQSYRASSCVAEWFSGRLSLAMRGYFGRRSMPSCQPGSTVARVSRL